MNNLHIPPKKKWINPELLGYLVPIHVDPIAQLPEWITIQPVLAMIASWKDISDYPKNLTELYLPKYILNF